MARDAMVQLLKLKPSLAFGNAIDIGDGSILSHYWRHETLKIPAHVDSCSPQGQHKQHRQIISIERSGTARMLWSQILKHNRSKLQSIAGGHGATAHSQVTDPHVRIVLCDSVGDGSNVYQAIRQVLPLQDCTSDDTDHGKHMANVPSDKISLVLAEPYFHQLQGACLLDAMNIWANISHLRKLGLLDAHTVVLPGRCRIVACPVEATDLWSCVAAPVGHASSLQLDHTPFDTAFTPPSSQAVPCAGRCVGAFHAQMWKYRVRQLGRPHVLHEIDFASAGKVEDAAQSQASSAVSVTVPLALDSSNHASAVCHGVMLFTVFDFGVNPRGDKMVYSTGWPIEAASANDDSSLPIHCQQAVRLFPSPIPTNSPLKLTLALDFARASIAVSHSCA